MFGVICIYNDYTCSVSFRNRIKRKQQEESSLNPLQREEPNEVEKNIIVTKRSRPVRIRYVLFVRRVPATECHTMMVELVGVQRTRQKNF